MKKPGNKNVLILLPLLLLIWTGWSFHDGLTERQRKGRDIYTTGKSASNIPVKAIMSGVEVPATVMPCIKCHGENGKGKPQGNIMPADISWESLSKAISGKNGRPAYDEKGLKKAIALGLKPDGSPLHKLMPKYIMGMEDIECLIDYLKVLGKKNPQKTSNE